MIDQICAFIHNYFVYGRYTGDFTIEDGSIALPFLVPGQYYRICGSRLNDGVHRYGEGELADETFSGVIWEMRVPRNFLALVDDIEAWQAKYGDAVSGPYQSESFGGYSYTLKSGATASGQADNTAAGWQGVFKTRLNEWRKIA